MRYLAISMIIAVVLVSGCVQFDDFGEARTGIPQITISSPDIQIDVEAFPEEVKEGRNISLYFDVWNKHEDMDIENFDLKIYDLCVFKDGSDTVDVWVDETIQRNRTTSEDIKLKTGSIDFERDCQIRFRSEYEASIIKSHTVAVLQESEYYQREDTDRLGEISISSTTTTNPLSISISFSDSQPFLDSEENIMYIDYSYSGDGYIDSLPVGSITLDLPDNMQNIKCNDYSLVGEVYSISRKKTFINKQAPRSTCTFTTNASQPIDSKTMILEGTYKYVLDDSLLVRVKPR